MHVPEQNLVGSERVNVKKLDVGIRIGKGGTQFRQGPAGFPAGRVTLHRMNTGGKIPGGMNAENNSVPVGQGNGRASLYVDLPSLYLRVAGRKTPSSGNGDLGGDVLTRLQIA